MEHELIDKLEEMVCKLLSMREFEPAIKEMLEEWYKWKSLSTINNISLELKELIKNNKLDIKFICLDEPDLEERELMVFIIFFLSNENWLFHAHYNHNRLFK